MTQASVIQASGVPGLSDQASGVPGLSDQAMMDQAMMGHARYAMVDPAVHHPGYTSVALPHSLLYTTREQSESGKCRGAL